jgi:small conductance mechanosensitive channel
MQFNQDIITQIVTSAALGISVLIVGLLVNKLIVKAAGKVLTKKGIDSSLSGFLTSLLGWVLKIVVVLMAASTAGIETTSFLALLGSAGLAVGLALQGSLSNFAGGVLILILKPFKVGDVITTQGFTGCVEEITTFDTVLKTPDNQVINLPNGNLANSPIVNINKESTRRVDFVFGVDYGDDIDSVKATLNELVNAESRVLVDPAPVVVLSELGDSSVNFTVRTWVKTEDYWGVYFDLTEGVKKSFDGKGISFPFPQTDVHLYKKS